MLYRAKAVFCFVYCLIIFSIIFSGNYAAAAKPGEVPIRGSKVLLTEGEAMKVTLTAEEPRTMYDVSFSAKRVGMIDPFGSFAIPFTVEVYESDQLVASESFTWTLGEKFEKVLVQVNNTPKIDERYKMLIRYDVQEDNEQKNIPIQINAESIRINGGNDGIDVHGRVKIVFSV